MSKKSLLVLPAHLVVDDVDKKAYIVYSNGKKSERLATKLELVEEVEKAHKAEWLCPEEVLPLAEQIMGSSLPGNILEQNLIEWLEGLSREIQEQAMASDVQGDVPESY